MITATATSLSAEQRAAKVRQITALFCKTVARGCTAAEEASAKLLADNLIKRYGIDPSECVEQTRRTTTFTNFDDFFASAKQQAHEQPREQAQQTEQPKRNHSHANCSHAAIKTERARCRKQGGPDATAE